MLSLDNCSSIKMSDLTGGFGGGFGMCCSATDTVNTNKYNEDKGLPASGAFLCEDDLMPLDDNSFGGYNAGYSPNLSSRNGHNFKQNAISQRNQQQKDEKNIAQNGWGDNHNDQQQKYTTVNCSKAKVVTSVDNGLQNNGSNSSDDKAANDAWGEDGGWSTKGCWDAEPASKDTLVGNIATASGPWADFDNENKQYQDKAKLSPFKSRNRRELVETNKIQPKLKISNGYRGIESENRFSNNINDGDNTSAWFEHDDRDGNDGQKPEDFASPYSRNTKDVANPNKTPIGNGSGSQFGKIHVKQKQDKPSRVASPSNPANTPDKLNREKDQGGWEAASFKGSSPGPSKHTQNDNVSEWGGWDDQNQHIGANNWNIIEDSSWDNQPGAQASNETIFVSEFPSTGPRTCISHAASKPNVANDMQMLKKDSVAVTSQPAAESKPTVSASPPKCAEIQKITKTLNILNISTPPTTQQSDSPKPNVASPFNTHNVSPFNMRAPPFETRHNKALSITLPNKQQQPGPAHMSRVVQKRSPQAVPETLLQQSPATRGPRIVKKQSPQIVPNVSLDFCQPGTPTSAKSASETSLAAGEACICNRLDARVICVTCGYEVEGRATKPCPVHPKRRCLTDRTSCADAECRSTNIVEVPKRPSIK